MVHRRAGAFSDARPCARTPRMPIVGHVPMTRRRRCAACSRKGFCMQLYGMLDSPYVRRFAVTLRHLGLPFEH
ncbi:glutathione S-transferase N-terminal domain-containing protein, partial [Raoultella terrigena]|uniref:glutathione S-transferase N-terminal domain-containing protein n=1 Tax=Raoultella terrigena TaxID=577 RepID=UPI00286E78BB